MLKNLTFALCTFLVSMSTLQCAEIKYEIKDIGTLQTHSSEAIAINNSSQVLGWYNVDGSGQGKHYFLRDTNGEFSEIPTKTNDTNLEINWKFLTDDGKAYGIFSLNNSTISLCTWDKRNGYINLGVLPGREIVAVNNAGQVLIKSINDQENGKTVVRPAIWKDGIVTKLMGLPGELGIESEESYGFDMNNKGEVVGQSLTSLVYKNKIFFQVHAVKWDVNGNPIDLHKKYPKSDTTYASSVNDIGNILINHNHKSKLNNKNCFVNGNIQSYGFRDGVFVGSSTYLKLNQINGLLQNDYDSPWISCVRFISINDKGDIIAEGKTIYGEKHAMLLTSTSSD